MRTRRPWTLLGVAALLAATVGLLILPATRSSAQVQQGATMTVLRGQVAVVRSDGSAIQPAPSGITVNPGDEIRTLGNTGALITFFSGTEIELDQNTVIAIEQVNRQGDRIDVSLRQIAGATINRVQTLTDSGSTYRIEAGGAVAVVRGTTFAVIGPISTSVGNIVIIVCLADCSPASTFAGCPLQPFLGYGVLVEKGRVESACVAFAVDRTAGLLSAAFEAVTTIEQELQGDTGGTPAGQVQSGQRQEIESRNRRLEDDDHPNDGPPPVVSIPTGTVTPGSGPVPTLSIDDVSVLEGANATFPVTLSAVSSQSVTVNFATANGTATAPGDYTPVSGTLTFPPGTTTQSIVVPIHSDTTAPTVVGAAAVEPPESFSVNLSGATGATIADPQGVGTILDPVTLTVSIDDASATEGANATFTVSLSAPSSQPVTVTYATVDGTATAPGDYTATSGTLTIPVNSTSGQIVVPTVADVIDEPAETFGVNLTAATGATIADAQGLGTILDDDTATLSIDDVSVSEGTSATFTVTLSTISSQPVTVNVATANGTATAGGDYTAVSGPLTIPAGSTTGTIVVPIIDDDVVESTETFAVNLTGATGATIADDQGLGTVFDDDGIPIGLRAGPVASR
jgi:hypothetical protein